jgi:hypothetical protein
MYLYKYSSRICIFPLPRVMEEGYQVQALDWEQSVGY